MDSILKRFKRKQQQFKNKRLSFRNLKEIFLQITTKLSIFLMKNGFLQKSSQQLKTMILGLTLLTLTTMIGSSFKLKNLECLMILNAILIHFMELSSHVLKSSERTRPLKAHQEEKD